MGWWSNLWKKHAEEWFFAYLDPQQVPGNVVPTAVPANSAYLSVFLKSMRITDVRKGLTKFYGTVHSFISLPHRSSIKPLEFNVLTTPGKLKNVDADAIDRVIQMDRRLLGPIPYRGGDLEMEVGLFSIKAADLAEPFLSILEQLSDLAGVSFVKAAMPFVQPLKTGIALLTGSNDDTLEIGMARTFASPKTGYFVVMRALKSAVNAKQLRIDASDFRLVDEQSGGVVDYPYMVMEISSSSTRDDWFQIQELLDAYKQLQSDVREGNYEKTKQSLVVFKRFAVTCDDLLQADGMKLADLVEKEINVAMPPAATGVVEAPRELIDFEKLPLYSP